MRCLAAPDFFAAKVLIAAVAALTMFFSCTIIRSEFYRGEIQHMYKQGCSFYRYGDYQRAEKCFRRVVALDDTYLEAYIALGNLAMINHDFKVAEDYYKYVIGKDQGFERKVVPMLAAAAQARAIVQLDGIGLNLKQILSIWDKEGNTAVEAALAGDFTMMSIASEAVSLTIDERGRLQQRFIDLAFSEAPPSRLGLLAGLFLYTTAQKDRLAAKTLEASVEGLTTSRRREAWFILLKLYVRMGLSSRAMQASMTAIQEGVPKNDVVAALSPVYGLSPAELNEVLWPAQTSPQSSQEDAADIFISTASDP